MNYNANILRQTFSICPECHRTLPAAYIQREAGVYLERECPEHGVFSSIAWRTPGFSSWLAVSEPFKPGESAPPCPTSCGLCAAHLGATCCVLLEVTERCNLNCSYCFAGEAQESEPCLEYLQEQIQGLAVPGETLLQLSGGEPTLRDDLPQLIATAKAAGCRYVQLNTNGLRLAEEPEYVAKLAAAGLSFVFLQFDGIDDAVYRTLRGRVLLDLKERAIANCARFNLGVTLVPTLVPGVNTEQIGAIIAYATSRSPAVRGVHFQPVCHMGRVATPPDNTRRYTLDQLMRDIEEQSGGKVRQNRLAPSCCDHPLCGFHGDFVVLPGGDLHPLSTERSEVSSCGCSTETTVEAASCRAGDKSERVGITASCCAKKTDDAANTVTCCSQEPIAAAACVTIEPIAGASCCASPTEAQLAAAKNRNFVARRWQRRHNDTENANEPEGQEQQPEAVMDIRDMATFLQRVRSHGFTITAMAFQDAAHLDLDRLRRCSLHVYHQGKHLPFCARYLMKA